MSRGADTSMPTEAHRITHRDFFLAAAPVSSGTPKWEFPLWSRTRPAAAAASDFGGGLLNRLTGSRWAGADDHAGIGRPGGEQQQASPHSPLCHCLHAHLPAALVGAVLARGGMQYLEIMGWIIIRMD